MWATISRTRDEQGAGSVVAGLAGAVLVGLTAVIMITGLFVVEAHRVQGAADLAAIAGAEAQRSGRNGCAAASEAAERNRVTVTTCSVIGDEVEFVVSVSTRVSLRVGPWSGQLGRTANAGVVTGAPP